MSQENLDRFNVHAQLEQIYANYPGVGNADTTPEEWQEQIRRDTIASNISHYSRLIYISTITGESVARVKLRLIEELASIPPVKSERETLYKIPDNIPVITEEVKE